MTTAWPVARPLLSMRCVGSIPSTVTFSFVKTIPRFLISLQGPGEGRAPDNNASLAMLNEHVRAL